MKQMTTVSEVINNLREKGYTEDFNITENCLKCAGNQLQLHPEDFVVDKHYRFEGDSNPDDEAIVYAISSEKYNMKGVLVNGYGPSADPVADEMVKALAEKPGATDL